MTISHHSSGSSSTWGGFMELCGCGVPIKIRTVTKQNRNRGRKFRGCGKYPEKDCGFFDWLYDDGPSTCAGCEKFAQRMNVAQNQIDVLTEKLMKMKVKKNDLKESSDGLQMKLCQVTAEKNIWKYGALVALAVSWSWFTFVLSWK